ncbi:hypothetical protein PAXRUDRAFT_832866 [Paxillus rubicundulus Ve08.2h10]|uniref:MYND-type domain-containing protein n=1 Tax=Paxillus rubicundulus Ve08.2h10 TaxID=930991 RepID=A0A0D0DIS3_9AGAM|nr:hypothetical protein PAXRUDRAFT_832866 [Paxillus rubicundulus Ve08.2h10]
MSSITDSTQFSTFHLVRTSHPAGQETFRMLATPKEVIKTYKSATRVACTKCGTILDKILTCQRCKSVWYCSKQCQKNDWSRHKPICTPVERSSGILKLIENILANALLYNMIALCTTIDLDLPNDKRGVGFDIPFMVRVDVSMEPSDVFDFVKLFLTKEPVNSKLEGMIQINRCHSYLPGHSDRAPFPPEHMAMWKQARAQTTATKEFSDHLVGMVEFVYNINDSHSVLTVFRISPGILEVNLREPFFFISGITGARVEKPVNIETCMESMNTHIRADKQNQLQLRAEMTEADIAIIRDAADKENNKEAVRLLREKVAREGLYANLPKPF